MFFLLFAPNLVTFLAPFGSLLAPLGSTWLPLWPPGSPFASLWSPFGPPWTLYWSPGALPWPAFGPNTSPSGVPWDPKAPFWSLLEAFWPLLAPSGANFGYCSKHFWRISEPGFYSLGQIPSTTLLEITLPFLAGGNLDRQSGR